ncbi:hypothetical protein O181_025823 [Austropuccinia psidii MF-1]|uniref:Reverse transcriptase Ty1/copia-type domain-containing protein n=1 Tax=Austropuccinia psidii MF-1 TaxID=1389203 RepID=A0A9Q3CLD2_9BASI|nr:hypothetical protein [Austropuccinia psidii MF-1]
MLNSTKLPNSYWAKAVSTAFLLSNSVPTPSRHNHSPYTLWTGLPPRIKKLRVFGCQAIVMTPKEHRDSKLGPTGVEGILLGYKNNNSAYRILPLLDRKILISRHVRFNESVFPQLKQQGNDLLPLNLSWETLNEPLSEPQLSPTVNSTPDTQELVNEPQVPMSHDSMSQPALVDETQLADSPEIPYSNCDLAGPPTCIKVIGPRHPTFLLSDINPNNILPYPRRAGALLMTLDNTSSTFNKAIAFPSKEGFTQTSGVDFDKPYSPTGRLNSLRTVINFSASNRLLFHQINIKSEFLNAPLAKTVHLGIPQGLKEDRQKYCLCLKKAIYGLWQAPLAWYKHLKGWLTNKWFKSCTLDPCVFYRSEGIPLWLYIHVDDIAIFGREVDLFKRQIAAEFEIKDIGQADLMLGVKITQEEGSITLDQQHFAKSLLELYGMGSSQPASTPLIPNCHLERATVDEVDKLRALGVKYHSAIGSIKYLSTSRHPNLSFSISTLSQLL